MEIGWLFLGGLVGAVTVLFAVVWIIVKLLRAGGQAYKDTIDKM